jgi:hypothetical protein
MKPKFLIQTAFTLLLLGSTQANAAVVGLSFSSLTSTTAQETVVFKADLSGIVALTQLASITVRDAGGTDGSPGSWSGFDFDAIRLSTTECATAACANGLVGIDVFDFDNNVIFTAGSLDPTTVPGLNGPCLEGTSGAGCDFDNSSATLGAFDGVYNNVEPRDGAGWLSLGRDGTISFNLTSLLALGGPMFMYIGEVGNNGETLRGQVEISDIPSAVPVPAAIWLFGSALVGFIGMARRRQVG